MKSKVEEKKNNIQRTKDSMRDIIASSENLLKIKATLKIESDKIRNGIIDLRRELSKLNSEKSPCLKRRRILLTILMLWLKS